MTPALLVVGWVLAALVAGLWWGERGRRLDLQRRETFGTPERSRLRPEERIRQPPPGPEERAAQAGGPGDGELMKRAIQRGADHLMAESKNRGTTLARAEAEAMAAELLLSAGPMGSG